MVKITKGEAAFLREKGRGKDVKMTHSNVRTYYAVENYKTMKLLERYRGSQVVYTRP